MCFHLDNSWSSPHGIMAKVMDRGLKVSKFKLQLCYYVHFQTLEKGMNLLIPIKLNSGGSKVAILKKKKMLFFLYFFVLF